MAEFTKAWKPGSGSKAEFAKVCDQLLKILGSGSRQEFVKVWIDGKEEFVKVWARGMPTTALYSEGNLANMASQFWMHGRKTAMST